MHPRLAVSVSNSSLHIPCVKMFIDSPQYTVVVMVCIAPAAVIVWIVDIHKHNLLFTGTRALVTVVNFALNFKTIQDIQLYFSNLLDYSGA